MDIFEFPSELLHVKDLEPKLLRGLVTNVLIAANGLYKPI